MPHCVSVATHRGAPAATPPSDSVSGRGDTVARSGRARGSAPRPRDRAGKRSSRAAVVVPWVRGREVAVGRTVLAVVIAVAALSTVPAPAQGQAESLGAEQGPSVSFSTGNFFFGGYLGISYGEFSYLEISPLVGYRFSENFGAGIGLFYRYSKDSLPGNDRSATDYGGNLFARYYVFSGVFTQAEYDYTSYEAVHTSADEGDRSSYESFLLGVGYNTAIGRGAGFYVLALYDFNYSDSNLYRVNDSPLQFRIGVSVGF